MYPRRKKSKKHSAFTLIELLIVVAIIGILSAIAVPNFLNAQTRAKLTQMKGTFNNMVKFLEMYRMDHNEWPVHNNAPNQNMWMTTPIAYVSSRPYDVFQDFHAGAEKQPWAHYGKSERFGCPHYEKGTYRNNDYWIIAIGPDGVWQSTSQYTTKTYDISNGLVSKGDMYVVDADINYIFH